MYVRISIFFLNVHICSEFQHPAKFQIYPPNKLNINLFKISLDCVDPAGDGKSALKAHWDGQVSSPQEIWPGLFFEG